MWFNGHYLGYHEGGDTPFALDASEAVVPGGFNNRPSVMFHGFANESTGGSERMRALGTLRALDRRLDGSRLTGQAAYGTDPTDPTSANLDVASTRSITAPSTAAACQARRCSRPSCRRIASIRQKPVLVLEYGRWADDTSDEAEQVRVFNAYYAQLSTRLRLEDQQGPGSRPLDRLAGRQGTPRGTDPGRHCMPARCVWPARPP